MRVLVLGMRRYSFTSKDTGEIIRGLRVSYIEPLEGWESPDLKGNPAMEIPADYSVFQDVEALPAVCDVEIGRRPGAKGVPVSTLVSVKFVKAVDTEVLVGGKSTGGSTS